MSPFHLGVVDKRLAHKNKEENVFVQDLRRSVPGTLPREFVEQVALPSLGTDDSRFFREYYLPGQLSSGERVYTLYNIPHQLPGNLFEAGGTPETFTGAEIKTLGRFYREGPVPGTFQLKEALTEMEGVVLSNILDPKGFALSEPERMRLANLLEELPGGQKEEVFHGGFHVSPTHPFFFEHPNEHVPGMMILEAGRQFAMACWHRFGGIPLKGYQFIMNELRAKFHDYISLNYPASFQAEIKAQQKLPTGLWAEANLVIGVIQLGVVCAEMEFPTQVVSKRSFLRLRGDRQKTDPTHRFYPIDNIHYKISLWDPEKARYYQVRLWDLSLEGFRVEFSETVEELSLAVLWEAILYFEEVGFIRSQCRKVWLRKDKDGSWAGFRFEGMGSEDRSNLQTAIKQYCHLRRERDQL